LSRFIAFISILPCRIAHLDQLYKQISCPNVENSNRAFSESPSPQNAWTNKNLDGADSAGFEKFSARSIHASVKETDASTGT